MFTPLVRLLMAILGLSLIIVYFQKGSTQSAYITLFGVALIIWGYFKNGTVYLAWQKIKKQDFAKAEKILLQTKYPHFLKKEQRGFYHFTKGLVEASKNNSENARRNFMEALKFGVRTENNVAIINLNLAEIEAERGNINEAKLHLQKMRSMKYNPSWESEITKIENKINIV